MTFRERFMKGETVFDEIFSLTDNWNFSDDPRTLREYLGLTPREEDIWVSESDEALEAFMEKERRTKAIFLDLDGTLFTDDKRFTDGNLHAVSRALEAGHQVVIATGRPLMSAIAQAKQLGFTKKGCCIIASNGAELYDTYRRKVLFRRAIPLPLVRQVFDAAFQMGLHCHTYNDEFILSEHETEALKRYSAITKVPYRVTDDIISALDKDPAKILVVDYDNQQPLAAYMEKTQDLFGNSLSRFFSAPQYLEHVMPNVSKGNALKMLCEYMDVPLCNSVAAGDEENDIPMLKAAAVGCAMKNAVPAVKEASDYITIHDNNHDGVAEIIEKFLLY